MRAPRRWAGAVAAILAAFTLGGCDWLGYLADASHSSVANDFGITMDDVPNLHAAWRWAFPHPTGRPHQILTTPATFHGRIFVGGSSGHLYAVDEATGKQLWDRDFGVQRPTSCPQNDTQGITGSPAVRDDGHGNPLVYLHSPDGYLYELDGRTGATVWRSVVQIPSTTENDVYAWSSPTLYAGRVYVGISSNCDIPFTRGAVKSYDMVTGQPIATGWLMPDGYAGAGVWTSVAVDASGAYVTTGSTYDDVEAAHPPTADNDFDQYSIMKLDPVTLAPTGKWPAPPTKVGDPDFGSSPILFTAPIGGQQVPMVGACNKDGNFYAVRTDTMQLVWQAAIGKGTAEGQVGCVSGGVWDGARLFVGGDETTINGTLYPGSVRELDPATGAPIWQTGLPANPLGSGTYNPIGILAYAGTNWGGTIGNGVFLIDPATGKVVRTLHDNPSAPEFAQPIWANSTLYMANLNAVVAWRK